VVDALFNGTVPSWLGWIPRSGDSAERLLLELVVAGFFVQVTRAC